MGVTAADEELPLVDLPCFADKLPLNATATILACRDEPILAGELPEELAVLSLLTYLDLSNTKQKGKLRGPLPQWLGPSLPALRVFDISGNKLEGTIPASFDALVALERLDLNKNELTGQIPDLPSLAALRDVDFMNNALSGTVPKALEHNAALAQLNFARNALTGCVSRCIPLCRDGITTDACEIGTGNSGITGLCDDLGPASRYTYTRICRPAYELIGGGCR